MEPFEAQRGQYRQYKVGKFRRHLKVGVPSCKAVRRKPIESEIIAIRRPSETRDAKEALRDVGLLLDYLADREVPHDEACSLQSVDPKTL